MNLNLDKSAWKRVTFADVVRNVNETVRDLDAAGVDRIIAMEHMDPGELKIGRWGSTEDGTTFTRRVRPGQTLFGKRRAYQRKVAYAEFDAVCSGDIYTFEADETQMLGEFLPFLVQSNEFFDHALDTSAGSLSPRTNWRDLANFEFDLPPLDEQKRIADLLWAIERQSGAIRHARHTTQELFRQLLVDFCVPDDTDRTTVGDVCDILDSKRVPLSAKVRATRQGTVPYYGAGGPIDNIDEALFDEPLVLLCEDGFGLAAWNERPIAYRIDGPAWVNNHAHVLRAREISTEWLAYTLMHYDLTPYLSTTVKPKLTLATAKNLHVRKAADEVRMVATLRTVEEARDAFNGELDGLARLRASMLAEVFGGN